MDILSYVEKIPIRREKNKPRLLEGIRYWLNIQWQMLTKDVVIKLCFISKTEKLCCQRLGDNLPIPKVNSG